jgi:hypothetical protein
MDVKHYFSKFTINSERDKTMKRNLDGPEGAAFAGYSRRMPGGEAGGIRADSGRTIWAWRLPFL